MAKDVKFNLKIAVELITVLMLNRSQQYRFDQSSSLNLWLLYPDFCTTLYNLFMSLLMSFLSIVLLLI